MPDIPDIESLAARIEALEAQLQQEQHENATLRRLLFTQYARQPRLMRQMNLPISDRAIILFEVLPATFDVEHVLATAEKLGLEESEAFEHLRTFLQEGMLDAQEQNRHFAKTGHRPYL